MQFEQALHQVRSWKTVDNQEIHVLLHSGIILHVVRKALGGYRIAFRERIKQ